MLFFGFSSLSDSESDLSSNFTFGILTAHIKMNDLVLARVGRSRAYTEKLRDQSTVNRFNKPNAFNGDLQHMFLVRSRRMADRDAISKRNLDRAVDLKRKRPDGSNPGRMRKMRREHVVPGENNFNKNSAPPRSDVLKGLKDMRDYLEQ